MGIYTVKRSLISAIALGGLVVSAQAADLSMSSAKDALPAIPDGPITWMGVTFYGTVDVGYANMSNGLPASGSFYTGPNYTIYGAKFAQGNVSTLTNNALSQSSVGLKIEENIGYGFQAIGKIETGFNPISGELADACASLLRNNGSIHGNIDNFGDGSRCGQAFNGPAYGGLSSPIFGTLTIGRQNSLVNDGMGAYDPMGGSYAFSLIGYSGTPGGGIGSTETARWDDSVKYILTYGPFHAAGMYTNGGQETPMVGDGYGANVGVTYMGFSVDGFYTKENGAVNLSNTVNVLPTPFPSATVGGVTTYACGAANPTCSFLNGLITNNEAWDVMAKYTFNVPGFFAEPAVSMKDAPCGGLKDAPCAPPSAKVTLFGGFQETTLSNPSNLQQTYNGGTTIGGYQYLTGSGNPFTTDRILDTAWAGASYEDGPWRLVGAWYRWSQNSYLTGAAVGANTCAAVTTSNIAKKAAGTFIGNTTGSNCSGELNQGSFLIDYTFNRHFDIYAGVTFSEISGGISQGYLSDNNTTFATGLRVKW